MKYTNPPNVSPIHVISIGGSVMHSLAIELQKQNYHITGSDDKIYEPSYSKLSAAGLLPEKIGWFPEKVHEKLSCVILGMHATKDNPELQRALALNLPVYSYPTFITKFCEHKQRIVIAGSHGKTTVTAMIMHVLSQRKVPFDYLIGAAVPNFDSCLKLSDAPIIIIEGDEYPSSALDATPKLLQYHHHMALLTGIAWDHINFYPTFDSYVKIFEDFVAATPPHIGIILYNQADTLATRICKKKPDKGVTVTAYNLPEHKIKDNITHLLKNNTSTPIAVFGEHNLYNLSGACGILNKLAISENVALDSLSTFTGARQRLDCVQKTPHGCVYTDYAHAPSKVTASTEAVKNQYPNRKLTAIFELHTFSSLSTDFISQYKNTLKKADLVIIYINPEVLSVRGQNTFTQESLRQAFAHKNLYYLTENADIVSTLTAHPTQLYLFMSSGTFGGLNLTETAKVLLKNTVSV